MYKQSIERGRDGEKQVRQTERRIVLQPCCQSLISPYHEDIHQTGQYCWIRSTHTHSPGALHPSHTAQTFLTSIGNHSGHTLVYLQPIYTHRLIPAASWSPCTVFSEWLWLAGVWLLQRRENSWGCPHSWPTGPPLTAETLAGSMYTGDDNTWPIKKKNK